MDEEEIERMAKELLEKSTTIGEKEVLKQSKEAFEKSTYLVAQQFPG